MTNSIPPIRSSIRLLCVVSIFQLVFSFQTLAQSSTTQVRFEVNMNFMAERNMFDPDTETVDLAGSFNEWGGNYTQMTDQNGDGIYSASIGLQVGQSIEFKARINGEWNGREEFAGGGPNRQYNVEANGVVSFWYNDDIPEGILSVNIYASNTFVEPGETIRFFDESGGHPVAWEWDFPGGLPANSTDQNPIISYSEAGNYDVSLTITNEDGERESKTFETFIHVGQKETFWWNEDVFYEIFVRSYKDSNGDGIGDLRGLIDNLDYLNDGNPASHDDLGIGGIWLMPVAESPSYHGYDVTDYRKIADDYGNNDDFKELMEEAHKRGIKIIVDYVMNHSSSQHPWFQSSRSSSSDKRDWYIWRNTHPGYNGPWGQNVWHSNNGSYYYGIFWGGMPDLNYETQAVKEEMFDVAKFWIEDMNVDGFRLDAIKFIFIDGNQLEDTEATFEFWREFKNFYKSIKPDVFAVGEAWTSTNIAQQYVNNGGLDYVFEFDLANAMLNAANNGNTTALYDQMDRTIGAYPYMQFGTFLTNHDINRVMDQLGRDESKAKIAADLLLTLPGIPYIYYGEEIGMTGSKPDEDIRTPLQWTAEPHAGFTSGTPWRAVKNDYLNKNIAAQKRDHQSLWQHYRKLISLRNTQNALKKGNYTSVNSGNPAVFSFLRHYDDEYILVISNTSADAISNFSLNLDHSSIAAADYLLVELRNGLQIPVSVNSMGGFSDLSFAELPPKSSIILKFMDPTDLQRDIHFVLDMKAMITSELFDPAIDRVYMLSNLNEFGSGEAIELKDEEDDGFYKVDIEEQPVGSIISYKYYLNNLSDAREEFADTDFLREYGVQEGDNRVLNVFERNTIMSIDKSLKETVVIYPNPAGEVFFIETSDQCAENTSYKVMDLVGRELVSGSFIGKRSISTLSWNQGIYLIKIEQAGQQEVFRLVVGK